MKKFFNILFMVLVVFSFDVKADECIHINDIGVKTVVNNVVKQYRPNINTSEQNDIISRVLDMFYKKYNISDASICVDTVNDMCKEIIVGDFGSFEAECKNIRSQLADTMRFEPICGSNNASGHCDETFSDINDFDLSEAKGLIEFYLKVSEPGKNVYCSNRVRHDDDNNKYIGCKITDDDYFYDYEYMFGNLKKAKAVSRQNRKLVANKGAKIAWPGADIKIVSKNIFDVLEEKDITIKDFLKFKNEDDNEGRFRPSGDLIKAVSSDEFKDATQEETYAYVKGISKEECEKYDKTIKEIFGGYAKFEYSQEEQINLCVTTWYPSFEKDKSVNRDFDKAGFGTDYMFLVNDIENVNLYKGKTYDEIIFSYLTTKAKEKGRDLTNIHCDMAPGLYKDSKRAKQVYQDTYKKSYEEDGEKTSFVQDMLLSHIGGKYSFIRCYGTYKNKVLVEDFMFYEKSIFGE